MMSPLTDLLPSLRPYHHQHTLPPKSPISPDQNTNKSKLNTVTTTTTAPPAAPPRRGSRFRGDSVDQDNQHCQIIEIEPPSKSLRTSRSILVPVVAAALYATCGIAVNFTNKAALMTFPLANVLLLLQMIAGIVILLPLRYFNVVSFPPLNVDKAKQLVPITLFYVGNVLFALLGLMSLNIPQYSTLKRLTPLFLILGKWRLKKTLPSRSILACVAVILTGCLIAGLGDLGFDPRGYCYALVSCTLQATNLLLVEGRGAKQGVGSVELLVYNSLLSLPVLLVIILCTGEGFRVVPTFQAAAQDVGNLKLALVLGFCSIAGMLLNFSLFFCTIANSALTTTIVGTFKSVAVTTLGFFLLGGVEFRVVNVAGIVLNTIGGIWYSAVRVAQLNAAAASRKQSSLPVLESSFSQVLMSPRASRMKENGGRFSSVDSFQELVDMRAK